MPKDKHVSPQEIADLHREAFCRSFLREGRRERMLAKPDEFSSKLHHDLPRMLRRGCWCELSPPVSVARLLTLVGSLTAERHAVYLGDGMEEGPHPIFEVINEITSNHSAVASLEAGALALYATEGCPRPDWYLLCSEAQRLAAAVLAWADKAPG